MNFCNFKLRYLFKDYLLGNNNQLKFNVKKYILLVMG